MNRPYQPSADFIALLQSVADEDLTPAEHRRLEDLIRDDAPARAFFAEYLQLHATLLHQAVGLGFDQQDASSSSIEELAESPADPPKESLLTQASLAKPAAKRTMLKSFLLLPAALAAMLLLAIGLPRLLPQHWQTTAATAGKTSSWHDAETKLTRSNSVRGSAARTISRPPAPVATLASFDAPPELRLAAMPLVVGQIFHEGETIHIAQGKARISVGFGAEIAAEAPCQLTFLARDQVRLEQGAVVVDVAPWAKGFTVVTDEMDVVDLGTTFSVSASGGATVETKVLSGLVRAVPAKTAADQQRSVLLTEGEGLFVDNLGNRRIFEQLPEEILSKLDFGSLAPYRPVELHNSGRGLAIGDQDPHWRVVAGPPSFGEPEFAQVCVPHERYLSNDPTESQWVSIRNWEKASPDSLYTFQTTFHLLGYDLSTMRLFGRFLADNGVAEVRVNGRAVPTESWLDQQPGQRFESPQFRFVNVTKGLREGENVIEIDVWNGGVTGVPNTPNHMALRAEWYAFGRQAERAADH